MGDELFICELAENDLQKVCHLVKDVFDEFVAPDFSKEGIETFYSFITPLGLKNRIKKGNFPVFTAKIDEKVIGVIALRDNNHIALLFVDKNYQRQKVAKKLFEKALEMVRKESPDLNKISVHSSLYAVEVYKRLGFAVIDEAKEQDGIKYVPMEASTAVEKQHMPSLQTIL